MFYFLSKRLDLLLSPLTWAIVFLALAIPWRKRSVRVWRRKRIFGALGLLMLCVPSMEVVSAALARGLEQRVAPTFDPEAVYDAVVLLGGVSDERMTAESHQPAYNDNVERAVMTARLLREGRAKVAIVSGAAEEPALAQFGEARVLADQLEEWGIGRDRILLEERARNTRENATYVAEMVRARGMRKVLVVTSAFHMPRAQACFRAVGLDVDVLPVDYRISAGGKRDVFPQARPLFQSTSMLREMLGLVVYRFSGYAR